MKGMNNCNYIGMVNKKDEPHGWGRAIGIYVYNGKQYGFNHFHDGQWKDGMEHGYMRQIVSDGTFYEC